MTAFEILLNSFYDTIEKSEPCMNKRQSVTQSGELNWAIRNYINTSFFNGSNLSYRGMLNKLIEEISILLKNGNHEEWARVKYVFLQNELNILRHDRNKSEVVQLKRHLDALF